MLRRIFEFRVLMAIVGLSKNPQAIDNVHFVNDALFEAITDAERVKFTSLLMEYPQFRVRYDEARPGEFDPEALAHVPHDTLGYHYCAFMRKHGYVSKWYKVLPEESPLHFARNRQYQTHDILHTVTGFSGSPIDELGLQGFYAGQAVPNPTAMMTIAAAALSRLQDNDPKENTAMMDHLMLGYAMGKNADRVIFRKWEDDLGRDITDLRAELRITPYVRT